MEFCDCCGALLREAEVAANPRWWRDLCDHCAGAYAAANRAGEPQTCLPGSTQAKP